MTMPETAVNKNGDAFLTPNEIRLAQYVRMSPPADETCLPQKPDEEFFGGLVSFASYAKHQLRSAQVAELSSHFMICLTPLFHSDSAVNLLVRKVLNIIIIVRLLGARTKLRLAFGKTPWKMLV